MKKIQNEVEDIVFEMCSGMIKAHPDQLALNEKHRIIKRKNMKKGKVALVTGGGSGHEPAHGGFVGEGMLDAVVCGEIFSSPSSMQVYQALLEAQSNKGVLLIIKNYSGDIMNFGAAAEMAQDDGIRVEKVVVNDDVAVEDSLYTAGRRGVAGTLFVHKIAGAAAERGLSLEEVKKIAQKVVMNVRTIGFALTSCVVPAKGTPTIQIEDDMMEFGVGIHGEPGIVREKMVPARELARKMLDRILGEGTFTKGDEIALIINGFGGTPLMELYILNNEVDTITSTYGLKTHKTFVGNYMTSLEMSGASISLLKLDDELKSLLGAPADTPSLKM